MIYHIILSHFHKKKKEVMDLDLVLYCKTIANLYGYKLVYKHEEGKSTLL